MISGWAINNVLHWMKIHPINFLNLIHCIWWILDLLQLQNISCLWWTADFLGSPETTFPPSYPHFLFWHFFSFHTILIVNHQDALELPPKPTICCPFVILLGEICVSGITTRFWHRVIGPRTEQGKARLSMSNYIGIMKSSHGQLMASYEEMLQFQLH